MLNLQHWWRIDDLSDLWYCWQGMPGQDGRDGAPGERGSQGAPGERGMPGLAGAGGQRVNILIIRNT